MTPRVSIIMATYNCADTVAEAIESIVNQNYPHWELIICDDASTDNTVNIIQSYAKANPAQIILLSNECNSKLSYSLNRCLDAARGEYIARMDADDLSSPNRIEQQADFLDRNPNIQVVGTTMRRFNDKGLHDLVESPQSPNTKYLRHGVPFSHATIMMRRQPFLSLRYNTSNRTVRGQDYDLWFRFFAAGFTGQNLSEPLYLVREDESALRRRTAKTRFNSWRTAMIGLKSLEAPISWYVYPTLQLGKTVVPIWLIKKYREAQAKIAKDAVST
jgi:glycosyltransferase EpsE